MPKPERISAMILPMRPVPKIPAVSPQRSRPVNPVSVKFPVRVLVYAWGILLVRESKRATACSATECGEYAGTRTTFMPASAAALRSTLLNPAQRKAMSLTPFSFRESITALLMLSFTNAQTASKPLDVETVRLSKWKSRKSMSNKNSLFAAVNASRS